MRISRKMHRWSLLLVEALILLRWRCCMIRAFSPAVVVPPPRSRRHEEEVLMNQMHHRAAMTTTGKRGSPRLVPMTLKRTTHQTKTTTALRLNPATILSPEATGYFYMLLLSLQFAWQPILTKDFASKKLIKSTYVLALDFLRIAGCLLLLFSTKSWSAAISGWTLTDSLSVAGLPALLYVVQNYCSLTAYQHLPPIAYNVLNQTKTLSAAVWCYLLMGSRQSGLQVVALFILLTAALVMEKVLPLPQLLSSSRRAAIQADTPSSPSSVSSSTSEEKEPSSPPPSPPPSRFASEQDRRTYWMSGVFPVLLASLISGLAGALVQKSLQLKQRNALLFSAELSTISILALLSSLLIPTPKFLPQVPDARKIREAGSWTVGWTARTWIPLMSNAAGGIVVGMVTKYAGAVRKGFGLIFGIFVGGILQNYWYSGSGSSSSKDSGSTGKVSVEQWVGGALVALSLWMHSNFPCSTK